MFHCPVGVWVIEQRAIMLSATVRSPTVNILITQNFIILAVTRSNMPNTQSSMLISQSSMCCDSYIKYPVVQHAHMVFGPSRLQSYYLS